MSLVSRTTPLPHQLQLTAPEPQPLGQQQPRPGSLVHDTLGRRETGSQSLPAIEMAQRIELPLLSRDQRASRSDRFDGGSSSSRVAALIQDAATTASAPNVFSRFPPSLQSLQARDVVLDMDRLAAATGLPAPGAPASTPQKDRIKLALDSIEFSAPEGDARTAQQALESRYIDWAAGVLEARENAFGNGRYSIDSDRSVSIGEALLPAVYDGVRQFLSSSSRSPVTSAVATALGPRFNGSDATGQRVNQGELNNAYDPAVLGGMTGGLTALTMDSTLLTAMDRRARLANLPQFAPVDLKALVPDPAAVQLRIVKGKKEYWQPLADADPAASPDRPTMASLVDATQQKRQLLATVQGVLQGQGWGLLPQPLITGAVNVLRRRLMPAASLLQAGPVAAGAVLASGSAGGITKFGLGLLKAPAYADVDNLVGGKQRVNLFSTRVPQSDVRAASWSDIGNLPRRAGEALVEAGSLARHYLAGPWRSGNGLVPSGAAVMTRVGDIAHAVVANMFATVFSTATGPLLAQVMRSGAASALPGEGQKSPAYLLQQFGQSATNDFVWQATKSAFKGSAFKLADSLDRWREDREVQLLQTARRAQSELPGLARQAERNLAGPGSSALRGTLQALQALQPDNEVQTATLSRVLGDLQRHVEQRNGAVPDGVGPLLQRIETALNSMEQRDATIRWRKPAEQH